MSKKQVLITPDGRKYTAQSEREATRLRRTAGYRPEKAKPEPKAPVPAVDVKSDDGKRDRTESGK